MQTRLDSRNVAASAGFGTTKRLLAGILHLSATEAGTRLTHATQLAARRALNGEVLPPTLLEPPGCRSSRGTRPRSRLQSWACLRSPFAPRWVPTNWPIGSFCRSLPVG
ncbi:MAG: hypothetical protein JO063_04610 [Pseudonocardiales bacterium]|nr:hypothetical protein [Pseudonocardiales bacterium]MBW0009392.1 hypothetical protein [Pseudonocardiales bacterium]